MIYLTRCSTHLTLIPDAQKTGVAQEAVKTATGKIGQMSAQEAQMILGVDKGLPWGEVVKVRQGGG